MALGYGASDDPREARMRAQAYMDQAGDSRAQPILPSTFSSNARQALSNTSDDTAIHFGAAASALNSQAELIGARAQADHMEKMAEINAANLKAQQRAQQRGSNLGGVLGIGSKIIGGLIGGPVGAAVGSIGGLFG